MGRLRQELQGRNVDPAPFTASVEAEPSFLLVMTATITPAANAGVKWADPRLRLEDYKRALRFWLGYRHVAAERILLLENSGADLGELLAVAELENPLRKEVEILPVGGNVIPEGTNYGYTEMQLLDDGLLQSRLRGVTTHMIKVTGRLVFPAIGRALDRTPKPFDVLIDCRKLGFPRRGFDAKTQIFAASHSFYDAVLRGSQREMNPTDLRLLEHLLAYKIKAYRGRAGVHLRFPVNVEPEGVAGFSARSYRSPKLMLGRGVRAVLRRCAPDYWF